MKRILALLLCLLAISSAALAECGVSREKAEDYTVQPTFDTPADDSAFANAMLIGDSIAGSIADYNAFPALNVEAAIGISPAHAHKSRIMMRDGQYVSLYQIALMDKPEKLFVLIGSNALGYKPASQVMPEYHALVDDLVLHLPDAEIYLLAVTPVGKGAAKELPKLTNDNICEFNRMMLDIAQSHGIYYIDVFTPLLNADGDAAADDYVARSESVHLTRLGIDILVNTLRMHTTR